MLVRGASLCMRRVNEAPEASANERASSFRMARSRHQPSNWPVAVPTALANRALLLHCARAQHLIEPVKGTDASRKTAQNLPRAYTEDPLGLPIPPPLPPYGMRGGAPYPLHWMDGAAAPPPP